MKIEIEVPDITTASKAINNATVAYGDIISAIMVGCEVPQRFAPLAQLSDEELRKRFNCLKSIYEQLEEIEKNI